MKGANRKPEHEKGEGRGLKVKNFEKVKKKTNNVGEQEEKTTGGGMLLVRRETLHKGGVSNLVRHSLESCYRTPGNEPSRGFRARTSRSASARNIQTQNKQKRAVLAKLEGRETHEFDKNPPHQVRGKHLQ